jgi:hypothetical protein
MASNKAGVGTGFDVGAADTAGSGAFLTAVSTLDPFGLTEG